MALGSNDEEDLSLHQDLGRRGVVVIWPPALLDFHDGASHGQAVAWEVEADHRCHPTEVLFRDAHLEPGALTIAHLREVDEQLPAQQDPGRDLVLLELLELRPYERARDHRADRQAEQQWELKGDADAHAREHGEGDRDGSPSGEELKRPAAGVQGEAVHVFRCDNHGFSRVSSSDIHASKGARILT